jgi:hypothetical protein
MFRFIICLVIAGLCGAIGYIGGAALTGTWFAALGLAVIADAVGFVGCEALLTKARRDEHPTTWTT